MNETRYMKILGTLFPGFKFRHEIFEENLVRNLSIEKTWLDIGCGDNFFTDKFGNLTSLAIGLDFIHHPLLCHGNSVFIQGDIQSLPFTDNSVDVVTLRMVVEHLPTPIDDFKEIERVLKPNGHVLFLTSNAWSPLVILPKLLPFKVKAWLLKKIFHESTDDIFPTYHKFNSVKKVYHGLTNFKLKQLLLIEQTSTLNTVLFAIFLIPMILTNTGITKYFRSNLFVVFQKENRV
jgi:ubiquinone/menaquinone biosynthesis C-methylase UbiE